MDKTKSKKLEEEIKGDQELYSYFVQRNRFLCEDNFSYLAKHPEVKQLISDYLSNCLIHKPDDLFKYTKEHFTKYCDNYKEKNRIVVIVGPSGVGKGSLISKLKEDLGDKISFLVSHTTRERKENEVDGKDYHFVSQETFLQMINNDEFLEYNIFGEDYFGTKKSEVYDISAQDKICVMEIDINGAKKLYHSGIMDIYYIAIYPPNTACLRERLRLRGQDSMSEINERLKRGIEEIDEMKSSNIFNFSVLNDDFNVAYTQFKDCFHSIFPEINEELVNNINDLNKMLDEYNQEGANRKYIQTKGSEEN